MVNIYKLNLSKYPLDISFKKIYYIYEIKNKGRRNVLITYAGGGGGSLG